MFPNIVGIVATFCIAISDSLFFDLLQVQPFESRLSACGYDLLLLQFI